MRSAAATLRALPAHTPRASRRHGARACRYAARACAVTFEHGNAFILPQHEGRFDRVHVGGLCALDKVPALLKLLKPAGGRLVVPSGPELLSITVSHGKARVLLPFFSGLARLQHGVCSTDADRARGACR